MKDRTDWIPADYEIHDAPRTLICDTAILQTV
jgi:hypothetical protein